jgi:acetoin utilization deacetylase AcuC-like enzyme
MALPLVHHPDYVTPLPTGYRFPMAKFGRLYEHLLAEAVAVESQFHAPPAPAPRRWLELAHEPAYIDAFCAGALEPRAMRRIGLPWSEALVHRTRTAVAGTVLTARLALEHGLACNTAGGTHHAFPEFGSGYCIFNDLAVAARLLHREGWIRRALVIDLDVHQGDGTAAIFASDPAVRTFSMHCEANFPMRKQRSNHDLTLPPGTGDRVYLERLGNALPGILDEARPDLVLYDAGVDPHANDRLGKLALTDAGLWRRDRMVLAACAQRGIPTACVIGGGYDRSDLDELTRRHALLHVAATEAHQRLHSRAPSPSA